MTDGHLKQSRTLKLTIAYDGTNYAGWQYQCDKPTVQDALENAVQRVTGRRVRVLASGRTDAGVHALGQVVGLRTPSRLPPEVLMRALNANLPEDIAVLDIAEAPDDFHPIAHVVRKRYRYVIHDGPIRDVFGRRYAWHYCAGRLDVDAMRRAAEPLLGTHDFSSFESSGAKRKTSVRTIFHLSVERDCGTGCQPVLREYGTGYQPVLRDCGTGCQPVLRECGTGYQPVLREGRAGIVIEIEADGFLYNMVRAIVGTLVEVGRGAQPESWPAEVLLAKDRCKAGPTAPPEGLFLVRVAYE